MWSTAGTPSRLWLVSGHQAPRALPAPCLFLGGSIGLLTQVGEPVSVEPPFAPRTCPPVPGPTPWNPRPTVPARHDQASPDRPRVPWCPPSPASRLGLPFTLGAPGGQDHACLACCSNPVPSTAPGTQPASWMQGLASEPPRASVSNLVCSPHPPPWPSPPSSITPAIFGGI